MNPSATVPEPIHPSAIPPMPARPQRVFQEGFDLAGFVEQGGRLVGRDHPDVGPADFAALIGKIGGLRESHPQLARQLGFLSAFFRTAPGDLPAAVRHETAFALLYAAKDTDLIPDDRPGIGYLDDEAVAALVLRRHAAIFEQFCAAKNLDWPAIEPPADSLFQG